MISLQGSLVLSYELYMLAFDIVCGLLGAPEREADDPRDQEQPVGSDPGEV